jgi:hypothetical protein
MIYNILHAVKFYVSVIANAVKQSRENEQILDCFTLRVRNDGHRMKYNRRSPECPAPKSPKGDFRLVSEAPFRGLGAGSWGTFVFFQTILPKPTRRFSVFQMILPKPTRRFSVFQTILLKPTRRFSVFQTILPKLIRRFLLSLHDN